MLDASHHPRRFARAAAGVLMALALAAGAATSGPGSESPSPTAAATTDPRSWGGIGDAGGGFRVTPTRVVFDDRTRSAELTLVNTGSAPTTYRVVLVHMRMSETGAITEIADALPGEAFADSLVRFSPRQVDLEPGVAQTVRMQLRKPAGLAPGEYRSHLVFRALPSVESEDSTGTFRATRGVSIALRPVFGAAIPVIVRQGETSARVEIGGLELRRRAGADGGPVLALEMRRTGNRSVYGDLRVTYTPPGGRPRIVGGMRGLAVYTPNPVRQVLVPLRADAADPWLNGTLRVTYDEALDERELLAEAELALR